MAERRDTDAAHVERLWALATDRLGPDWHINGSTTHRYHGNLNIRRDGLDVARLMSDLRDIAFSAGSACASGSGRSSHVLRAIGLSESQARSSIRLGFGRYTTEAELTEAIDRIVAAADNQRTGGVIRHALHRPRWRRARSVGQSPATACSKLRKMPDSRWRARARGKWPARPAMSSSPPRISRNSPRRARMRRTCSISPPGATRTSRLACQIILSDALDGLTVRIPGEVRNMQGR